jgi:ribosomal protein L21E
VHRFTEGDSVRVDIPDTDDPDHDAYHGRTGDVIAIQKDDAGTETGDARDSVLYRVRLADGEEMDFRWRDLRPAPNSE